MAQVDARLRDLIEKGESALKNEYFDLADGFLSEALSMVSQNEEILKLLDQARAGRGRVEYGAVKRWIAGTMARLKMLMGKHEAAASTLEYIHKGYPGKFGYAMAYGKCCYKLDRVRDGILALESAIAANPKSIPALTMISEMYRAAGKFEEAIQMTERLRLHNPDDRKLEKVLKDISAMAYADRDKQTKLKDARGEIEKARVEATDPTMRAEKLIEEWKKDPGNKELRLDLARALRQADQRENAVGVLNKLLAEEPKYSAAWLEMIQCALAQKDWQGAENAATHLLEIDPADAEAKGYYQEAKRRRLEDAWRKDPSDEEKKKEYRDFERQLAADDIQRLERLLRTSPGADTSLALGRAYLRFGDADKAVAQFQIAAQSPQFSFTAHKLLGDAYGAKQMYDLALDQYRTSLQKSKGFTGAMPRDIKEIYFSMGESYTAAGDLAEAEKAYKELYQADINYLDIRQRYEQTYAALKDKQRAADA